MSKNPIFERRHYTILADFLGKELARHEVGSIEWSVISDLSIGLGVLFRDDNPRYDSVRFHSRVMDAELKAEEAKG